MVGAEGLVSTAAIVVGFGVATFIFRLQRELWVRDKHPEWPTSIPMCDYLALGSILMALVLVILPLAAFGRPQPLLVDIAAAACASSVVLLVGYIPAVLAHYGIRIGSKEVLTEEEREHAEPGWVIGASFLAVIVFLAVIYLRQQVIS